jgi:hypothetical protein
MSNQLDLLRQSQATIITLLNQIVDDEKQTLANKFAAIVHGTSSANQKQSRVRRLLLAADRIEPNAHVHVKNGDVVASQIAMDTLNDPHYVAALLNTELGPVFRLVRFDAATGRQIGFCCHGRINKSDARRAKVGGIGQIVYEERINYDDDNNEGSILHDTGSISQMSGAAAT